MFFRLSLDYWMLNKLNKHFELRLKAYIHENINVCKFTKLFLSVRKFTLWNIISVIFLSNSFFRDKSGHELLVTPFGSSKLLKTFFSINENSFFSQITYPDYIFFPVLLPVPPHLPSYTDTLPLGILLVNEQTFKEK